MAGSACSAHLVPSRNVWAASLVVTGFITRRPPASLGHNMNMLNRDSWRCGNRTVSSKELPLCIESSPLSCGAETSALGRLGPFAEPSGDDRYLRSPDGWSRRITGVASHGLGRLNWAESAPTGVASGGRKLPSATYETELRYCSPAARRPSTYIARSVSRTIG